MTFEPLHLLDQSQLCQLLSAGAVRMATRFDYHAASYTGEERDPWAPVSTHFIDKAGREVAFFNHQLLPWTGLVAAADRRLWSTEELRRHRVEEIRDALVDRTTSSFLLNRPAVLKGGRNAP